MLASLAPAGRSSRGSLAESLNAGGAVVAGGSGRLRGRLVAGELALALVLAVSAGVLIRTVAILTSQPIGFDASHVFTTGFGVPFNPRAPMTSGEQFYQGVLARVRRLPGVKVAALTADLPFDGYMSAPVMPRAHVVPTVFDVVTPGYFPALAIPLLRGRGFGPEDRAGMPDAVIVNRAAAAKFWPGRDPLGRQFTTGLKFAPGPWTVVGVAGDTRVAGYRPAAQPEIFFPLAQVPYPGLQLVLRTTGDPAALLRPVRAAAASVDRNIPLVGPQPLSAILIGTITQQRFLMKLLAIAAALGLLLARVGVYGAVGTWTAERTRERGVRMALGADRGAVLGLVLGCAARWTAAGAAIGAGGAYLATRALRAYLFGVKPGDPATLALAAALLFAVALAAAWLPARRAAGIGPAVALRRE